jgi:H+/Cl- antiporter ClcA
VSTDDRRILTITGMAAGFTALFGAPLGAAIFALEILHRRGLEYYEAVMPAVLGALSGYAVDLAVTNDRIGPLFKLPPAGPLHRTDLLWGVAAGVAGAAVAATFSLLTQVFRGGFRRLPTYVRPVLGGVALGLLAFWSPYALTYGEGQLTTVAVSKAAAATFGVALLAKLCSTTLTLSSGWRGGFIIPLFFMGAATARFGHALFPHGNQVVLIASLMAAASCGVTKTPLGSTLIVTSTAGLQMLPPVLIAAVVAMLLTSQVAVIHTQQPRHHFPRE